MAAITNPHRPQDVGTLLLGGIDVTCAFQEATWTTTKTDVDVSSPCLEGQRMQTMGIQGNISGSFYGGSSNGFVTNYLDFSGISVGGVLIQPQTYTMSFNGGLEKADLPAFSLGQAQGVIRRNFSGSLEMLLDDTELVNALLVAAESMTVANYETTLSFTLSGTAVEIPIKLGNTSHPITRGDFQRVTIDFSGQAPNRGTNYPTTPTALPGTPGLLDWALLSPRTNLAFQFINKATTGLNRTGTVSWGDFSFTYSQREITVFNYSFDTYGNFTTALAT